MLCAVLWTAGCSTLLAVSEQQAMLDTRAVLGGTVRTDGWAANGPLVVGVAARGPEGFRLVDHFVSEGGGAWVIALEPGTYWVVAFEDANGNGHYDDEPAWAPAESEPVTVATGQHRLDLQLVIPRDGRFRQKSFSIEEVELRGREQQQSYSLFAMSRAGEVVTLDDPRFADDVASSGMWRPYDFLLQAHPGIYFLEPYDPSRLPVLFVHGIGGTPTNFRGIVESLDRSRYQAWVAYYPSGGSLDGISLWMSQMFSRLRTKHRFERAAVVAHSMGGLVARAFVLRDFETTGKPTIRTFVTIASPLGGMASAGAGVERSPIVIRSWYGLAPGSPFLDGLFWSDLPSRTARRSVPAHVDYHLLFAYRGGAGSEAGDGVVALSSQLRPEAQQEARSIRGYDETHTSILEAPAVAARLDEILSGHAPDGRPD